MMEAIKLARKHDITVAQDGERDAEWSVTCPSMPRTIQRTTSPVTGHGVLSLVQEFIQQRN